MCLALSLLLSQLGSDLVDRQIHCSQDDVGFKGLILLDKSMMVPPDGSQDGTDQEEGWDVVERGDVLGLREKKTADIVRCPDSILHISR